MEKEDRRELAKMLIRFAEITFTVMVASPAALLLIKGEIPLIKFAASFMIGAGVVLTFAIGAIRLLRKR